MTFIFNITLQQSIYLDKWKEADVILLPTCTLPDNFNVIRLILLTATLGKILKIIVCDEIINKIDQILTLFSLVVDATAQRFMRLLGCCICH